MADTWYCIKCGRNHREGSHVAWQHGRLRADLRADFEPETVAVGVAMAAAAERSRTGNSAARGRIAEEWDDLDLERAFPGIDLDEELRDLKRRGLIGRTRHSGREWFEFLANEGRRGKVTSPRLFGQIMKGYLREYRDSAIR